MPETDVFSEYAILANSITGIFNIRNFFRILLGKRLRAVVHRTGDSSGTFGFLFWRETQQCDTGEFLSRPCQPMPVQQYASFEASGNEVVDFKLQIQDFFDSNPDVCTSMSAATEDLRHQSASAAFDTDYVVDSGVQYWRGLMKKEFSETQLWN